MRTAADFTGKSESDVEDLIGAPLYCRMVNAAFRLGPEAALTETVLQEAAPNEVRVVRAVQTASRRSGGFDFDHYSPAHCLLGSPEILQGDDADVGEALERFEAVFRKFNRLLGS